MKRREDIYNLGNDYFQKTDVYFVTADEEAAKSADIAGYKAYSDGLFHFTTQPVYELSGGVSALNKRIFNFPQADWTDPDFPGASAFTAINDASAVLSPDYAKGVVIGLNGTEETTKSWSGTPGDK